MDDLKEKLAAQEVELKQKNDDADALIQRVGLEQEKVAPYNNTELSLIVTKHFNFTDSQPDMLR